MILFYLICLPHLLYQFFLCFLFFLHKLFSFYSITHLTKYILLPFVQEEVSKKTFTAKQPLVEVEVNGDTEITKINISKDIEKEDIEVLEDMILIATNEAISAAKKEMEEKLGKIGQGLPNIF